MSAENTEKKRWNHQDAKKRKKLIHRLHSAAFGRNQKRITTENTENTENTKS